MKWTNFLKYTSAKSQTQEEIDNPNRPLSVKESESIINSFPKQKVFEKSQNP